MKDSGVAYIGEIGCDFDVKPINSLFAIKKDIIGHEPDMVLSITQNGIKPKDIESNEGQIAASYANYQIVNIGDFAMNHMDLITGGVDISKYEGVTSPDYRVFVLKEDDMVDKFFLYIFQTYYKTRTFFGFGQGVANLGRWRLPASNFKNILIPITTTENQKKIVEMLDKKCSKIETLIANQQKQIEKLKQYKQSLITEVVTKGLNPDVEMKDSGVEWIGEIPKQWDVARIKDIFYIIGGNGFPENLQGRTEGDYPFCKVSDINGKEAYVHCAKNYVTEEIVNTNNYNIIPKGSIIFAKIGAALQKNHRKINIVPCCIDNNTEALVPKISMNSKYLYYMLTCIDMNWFDNKSTIPSINNTRLLSCNVPYIQLTMQDEIVSYLDIKCDKIDTLITIKQQKIEKLIQYKKSIIYEYVTGKKEA